MTALDHVALGRELVLEALGVHALEREAKEGFCGVYESLDVMSKDEVNQIFQEGFKHCPVSEADDWQFLGNYLKDGDLQGFLKYAEWITDYRLRNYDLTLITPKRSKASNDALLTIIKFCQPYLPADWVGWQMSDIELLDHLDKQGFFDQEHTLAPWADNRQLLADNPDKVFQHECEVEYDGETYIKHITSTVKEGIAKGNGIYHVGIYHYTKKAA